MTQSEINSHSLNRGVENGSHVRVLSCLKLTTRALALSGRTMTETSFTGAPGPKEIDGLFVSPGKASLLLTDHLITGYPLGACPGKVVSSQTLHTYKPFWLGLMHISSTCWMT